MHKDGSEWVLLYVAFSIMAISRQIEARSRDNALLLSNNFRALYSALCHRQHSTLQGFEQFGALYMHNLDDKYPTRPGFATSTSELRATARAWALVQWLKLPAWKVGESRVRTPPWPPTKFQRNEMFLPRSLVMIQYCEEPPWPRGSVLGLRPPGLEFQILCLEVLLAQISLYVHKSGLKPIHLLSNQPINMHFWYYTM